MDTTLEEKVLHPDAALIEALGGTSQVAAMCEIKSPSVSEWKRNGIPKAQRKYLELARPDVFSVAEAANATPTQAKAA